MKPKILIVRKMSALEFYYNGNHKSRQIIESHENHNQSVEKTEELIKKAGGEYRTITRRELSEELVNEYDAVISAGGDGTVIATAAFNKNIPQLNLKTDSKSVGALCQKDTENALKNFLNSNYKIEEWTRQDVYHDGKFIDRALNET
ncbi:MAG: hypothetical protein PHX96_05375, partial [Candidatus Nanoarchaeia archaeon]|nr:hypothetical protein [Candidatus Nanoarchaeia archaeon]